MPMPLPQLAAATLFMAVVFPLNAAQPIERWRNITGGSGGQQLIKLDFDGDGRLDLAVPSVARFPIARIFGTDGGGRWLEKQALTARLDTSSTHRYVGWSTATGSHLVFLSDDGKAIEFSGWPLVEQRRFTVPYDLLGAAVGDIDADGVVELVMAGRSEFVAVDTETLLREWNLPPVLGELALSQLDGDAGLEIVAAQSGLVIDGATRLVEWDYPDPFGLQVAAGRFGSAGEPGFVGNPGGRVVFHRTAPWSPVWEHAFSAASIAAVNPDADGFDEVLLGAWSGDVRLLDPRTREVVREWLHLAGAAHQLDFDAFADPGQPQLVVAGGDEHVFRAWTPDGVPSFSRPFLDSPLLASAQADVDGDGRLEVLLASADQPAILRVLDARDGALEWEVSGDCCTAQDPYYIDVVKVLVGQVDTDPAREVVLVGATDARVIVIDAATRQVQSRIGSSASGPFRGLRAAGAALADLDADGLDDLLLGTWSGSGAGTRLRILPAARLDGAWESVALGSTYNNLLDVLIVQSDADPALEIVAVLPDGLRAFDASTRLLDWTLEVAIDAVAHDPQRNELFVLETDGISVYSLATRSPVRELTLPSRPDAMALLPGDDLAAIVDGALLRLDAATGAVRGSIDFVGPKPWQGDSRLSVAANSRGWQIVSSTELGQARYDALREPWIFQDTFGD